MNKCPHCEQEIKEVRMEPITGIGPSQKAWKCIGYTCPHCSKLISVQMDHFALKTDILDGVRTLLAAQPMRF